MKKKNDAVKRFYIRLAGNLVSDYGVLVDRVSVGTDTLDCKETLNLRLHAPSTEELIELCAHAGGVLSTYKIPWSMRRTSVYAHLALDADAKPLLWFTAHLTVVFGRTELPVSDTKQLASSANV